MICLLMMAGSAFATIFSTVKGIVHDAQHRPVGGATITLKARQADWSQTATTSTDGSFQIPTVPVGEYILRVTLQGFATVEQPLVVVSDTAPELHVQLEV